MLRLIAATSLGLVLASTPATARQGDCPAYAGETITALAPDFAGIAPFPGHALPQPRAQALAAALDEAQQATGAPDIGAAVLTRQGQWASPQADQPFAWASVAKLVTAVIVMQLAEEGLLARTAQAD